MATNMNAPQPGTQNDFQIYQEEFHTAATEIMMQDAEIFNAASNGSIILSDHAHIGHYSNSTFFDEIAIVGPRVSEQTTAAAAQIADTVMTSTEDTKVKLDRRIGPVLQTLDAFKKLGMDPSEMSYVLGTQWGKAILVDFVNTALPAAAAAFGQNLDAGSMASSVTAHNIDATTATLNHGGLVQAQAAFGDSGKDVAAWVMHSKQYYDLLGQSIADGITDVASVAIHTGQAGSLNKPIIVTDCPGLINNGVYTLLALKKGAITVEESEQRDIVSQLVTGQENLAMRFQGEYAFTLGLKGYAYDRASATAMNPNEATLTSAAAWEQVNTDHRSLGGVVLRTL